MAAYQRLDVLPSGDEALHPSTKRRTMPQGGDLMVEFGHQTAFRQAFHDCGKRCDCTAGKGFKEQLRHFEAGRSHARMCGTSHVFPPGQPNGPRCGTEAAFTAGTGATGKAAQVGIPNKSGSGSNCAFVRSSTSISHSKYASSLSPCQELRQQVFARDESMVAPSLRGREKSLNEWSNPAKGSPMPHQTAQTTPRNCTGDW